ncbi:MAG: right-handed parallel beta-helix repeat-containing protein [Ignavibacteria bacterium]|nr:right-handed parallel beta-helix repeat-containing protein [Ignavibacteria bacterium]
MTQLKTRIIHSALITICAVVLLAAFSQHCYPGYTTPGNGRVWNLDSLVANSQGSVTFSGGSYFLNDTLTISQSDTVRIRTDFTLQMRQQTFIDIFGVLITDPPVQGVITAADTALKFLGLKFEDQSDGSYMKKTVFEYGNGIRMLDCNITIDSCIIRFNTLNSAFSSSAISLFRSNSVISNCSIYRNRRAAISSGANITSSPVITGNRIFENNTENANVPQINLGAAAADTLIIRNNIIRGLYDNCGGISLLPVGSIPIALIEGNVISRNRYGIAVGGGNSFVIIRNNRIDSNNIQGLPNLGGSGINFNGSATQVSIVKGNTLRNNLWGITIQGTAKPNMGDLSNSVTLDDGYNMIYDNGNSGRIYDLFNNTPDSIKAENNWWNTNDPDTAEAHIFHGADSSALGFVDFLPMWPITSSGPNPAVTGEIRNSPEISVFPNPFNPEVSFRIDFPKEGYAELKLYDISGKETATLFSGNASRGNMIVRFSNAELSAGVYFYRLVYGKSLVTGRIVLLK